jgi:hypothetical protein
LLSRLWNRIASPRLLPPRKPSHLMPPMRNPTLMMRM